MSQILSFRMSPITSEIPTQISCQTSLSFDQNPKFKIKIKYSRPEFHQF